MQRDRLLNIAREVFALPTAPYAEHFVVEHIRAFCARRKYLRMCEDAVGNIVVEYRRGRHRDPVFAFHAHMDHPGMVVGKRLDMRRVQAAYLGGGPRRKLVHAPLHVFSRSTGEKLCKASVERVSRDGKVVIALAGSKSACESVAQGDFTMYAFPAMRVTGDLLYTRGCDDLASVAALLALLDELQRRRVDGRCYAFFTRAEEVGCEGAVAAALDSVLPHRVKLVGLETSSARAGADIGGGPVVRVGDRRSIFDRRVTQFLSAVALEREDSANAPFQRRLMDGGTCETGVFCAFGFEAGALCLPLGNYHNIGESGEAAPEYISISDLDGLVELMIAVHRMRGGFDDYADAMAERYRAGHDELRRRLIASKNGAPLDGEL